LARHRLNSDLIANNWDDTLRVAGSLKLGVLCASEFMRTIQSSSRTSALMRASAELGRIAKSSFAWITLTTRPIADASWFSSTAVMVGIASLAPSSMASAVNCGSDTGKGRRTSF
jgi:hypothetical protein